MHTKTGWKHPNFDNEKGKDKYLSIGELWFTLKDIETKEDESKRVKGEKIMTKKDKTYMDVSSNPDFIKEYSLADTVTEQDIIKNYFREKDADKEEK